MPRSVIRVTVDHEIAGGIDDGYALVTQRGSFAHIIGELSVEDLRAIRDGVVEALDQIQDGKL